MEEKVMTPAVKGIVISLVLILLSLVLYFTGESENTVLKWVQFFLFGGGIIWADIYYAQQLKGNVTFGNVFAHGFKTSAAITVIVLVYTFIFIKFISPELVDKVIIQARIKWEEAKLTSAQMQQAEDVTRKYFLPFAIGGVLFMYMVGGLIFSLIGAALSKKNPEVTPFTQN